MQKAVNEEKDTGSAIPCFARDFFIFVRGERGSWE
jgi:hypothetical protein